MIQRTQSTSQGQTAERLVESVTDNGALTGVPEHTDLSNADELFNHFGDILRSCPAHHAWYHYGRGKWHRDEAGFVRTYCRDVVRRMFDDGVRLNDKGLLKHAYRSAASSRLDAMLKECPAQMRVVPKQFDCNPWLFNTQNGTLDLETGFLRPHDPADLQTKMAPVEYDLEATCPTWDRFIREATCGNERLARYLQQLSGVALTGDVSEQILPVMHGCGRNGKSVFLETLMAVMGDYATLAAPDLLVSKQWCAHPTEVADLHGRRLVIANETERGQHLRIGFVKQATGDTRLKARYMRCDFFEFRRTFKLWLVTNHKPMVDDSGLAIWRRLRLVPFDDVVSADREDTRLGEKLHAELPGILAWCVRGCRSWLRDGLQTPVEVVAATAEYQSESDAAGRFVKECLVVLNAAWSSSSALTEAFEQWCHEEGINTDMTDLWDRLREAGCQPKRDSSGRRRGWRGVGIESNQTEVPA